MCLSLLDNLFFFWQSAQLVQNFNVGHESCDCVFGDGQRELCNPWLVWLVSNPLALILIAQWLLISRPRRFLSRVSMSAGWLRCCWYPKAVSPESLFLHGKTDASFTDRTYCYVQMRTIFSSYIRRTWSWNLCAGWKLIGEATDSIV